MDSKTVIHFLKDQLDITIGLSANALFLFLYNYLTTEAEYDFLYPFAISFSVYLVLMVVRWHKYYGFYTGLNKSVKNMYYDLQAKTNEQKKASQIITRIHEEYVKEIHEIYAEMEDKKYFLSRWIHNMKTPISIMDLVIQKYFDGSIHQTEALKSIEEEKDRLLNTLEQVLNILRLEDFSRDYVPDRVDLIAAVRKVINDRKNQFIYYNLFPKLICDRKQAPVLSDSKWNEVMLEQIVSNAIKYSDAREKSKKVFFYIQCNKKCTTLMIRDEGIGIPEHDIKRIFEPFFTGENGRKCKNATGIGLYVAKIIADRLGHDLTVESKEKEGTTVTIRYLTHHIA